MYFYIFIFCTLIVVLFFLPTHLSSRWLAALNCSLYVVSDSHLCALKNTRQESILKLSTDKTLQYSAKRQKHYKVKQFMWWSSAHDDAVAAAAALLLVLKNISGMKFIHQLNYCLQFPSQFTLNSPTTTTTKYPNRWRIFFNRLRRRWSAQENSGDSRLGNNKRARKLLLSVGFMMTNRNMMTQSQASRVQRIVKRCVCHAWMTAPVVGLTIKIIHFHFDIFSVCLCGKLLCLRTSVVLSKMEWGG